MLALCLVAASLDGASRLAPVGRVLTMDQLRDAQLPSNASVAFDSALHTYRVDRRSRPGRLVRGPQHVSRILNAPHGRFETAVSPLRHGVSITLTADDNPPVVFHADPGKWTHAYIDFSGSGSVRLEETLDAPADEYVVWADDRVMVPPAGGAMPPDVILVSLDTTRPDYLTPYNSQEHTTPALAQLAAEGMRFDQATSVSSWTLPGHMALMTGTFPGLKLGYTERVGPEYTTLAEVFSTLGYTTFGASGGPYTDSDLGFQQGFQSYLDSSTWKNAEHITDIAIEKTLDSPHAPVFLFLNYFNAHEPNTGISLNEWEPVDTGTTELTPQFVDRVRAGYRHDLEAIDQQLGRLFDTFKTRRNWQNTIVVVLADHGQLLGERGGIGHSLSLDEELVRVPLIVKGTSGRPLRGTYAEQIQLPDVYGLTLELAAAPTRDGALLGRIEKKKPVRSLAYFALHHDPNQQNMTRPRWRSATQWGVRTDSIKVVRDLEGHVTTVRTIPPETAAPNDVLTTHLLAEMDRFFAGLERAGSASPFRLQPDTLDRLRALGYIR